MEQPITGWCLEGCDWLLYMFIEINFSKLTDSKKKIRNEIFSQSSALKSAVFGSSSDSSLPPLIGSGGGLVCESVGKAEMRSTHFDGKSSRDLVDLPSTCYPSNSLTTFAFRSRKVKRKGLGQPPS